MAAPDPCGDAYVIEAAGRAQAAWSEIRQSCWEVPIDKTVVCADVHMVDLCLTPRPQGACACFTDKWSPNRFERIGDVFLLPAGSTTKARAAAGQQKSVITYLNTRLLQEWIEGTCDWSDRQLLSILDVRVPQVRTILVRLAEELENPGFACESMTELLNLQLALELGRFLRDVPDTAAGGLAPWRLKLIDERIADGAHPPSLTDLARLVSLSVRHLTRGFRDSRGVSIGRYIEDKRIMAARRLLEGRQSIKEIASQMGFASQSGFSYAFKMRTGESPQAYRSRSRREG